MFDFSDHVVMITGANGGLGQAVVRAFQAAGATLVLVGRSLEDLETALPDVEGLFVAADVTNPGSVTGMVSEAVAQLGRLNVLVNVVGGYRAGMPVHETPLDTWESMLKLNARSVLLTGRAVVPHMLQQGSGKIINIGSKSAFKGGAEHGAYSVAKAAVVRLTESMAAELKSQGINVNCVIPGTIDTPANRRAMPRANTDKWVAPEDLANVILFLASDAARAIHGAHIPVYGLG